MPVPETTSPATPSPPYRAPAWNANPPDAAGWKALVDRLAAAGAAGLPALRETLLASPANPGG
ncbi:hypothetical protein ACRAWF_10515 [Streptomyces sp. L7]